MSKRYRKLDPPAFIQETIDVVAAVLRSELLCPPHEAQQTASVIAEELALSYAGELLYVPKTWAELERRDRAICHAWDGSPASRERLIERHAISRESFDRIVIKGRARGWIDHPTAGAIS